MDHGLRPLNHHGLSRDVVFKNYYAVLNPSMSPTSPGKLIPILHFRVVVKNVCSNRSLVMRYLSYLSLGLFFLDFSLFYLHPINRLSCLIFLLLIKLKKIIPIFLFAMNEKVESFFENIFRWFIITLHTVREISNTLFGIYMEFMWYPYGVLLISFKRY